MYACLFAWVADSAHTLAADGLSGPVWTIRQFLNAAPSLTTNELVRIRGAVTFHSSNGPIFVQDDTGGLFARAITNSSVQVGDVVEVVGRVLKEGYSPTLQDCVYWTLGEKRNIAPKAATGPQLWNGDLDMQLVQVEGRLLTVPALAASGQVLHLDCDHVLVPLELQSAQQGNLVSQLRPGSLLRARGVCSVGSSGQHRPTSVRVQLRSEADIHVLAPPPWWTTERALSVSWVALALGVAALGWVRSLRHQVQKQTLQIQARLRSEAALEEQYRRIVDTASEGILLLDSTGRICFSNRHIGEMLGYGPEELLGRSLLDFVEPTSRTEVQANLRPAVDDSARKHFDIALQHRDGSTIWVSAATSSFSDQSGASTLAMLTDITERKRMEAKARELNQLLETKVADRTRKLQEMVGELEQYSYSISHDMRGPLRAMNQFSSIVLEEYAEKLGPQGQDYLRRIAAAAARLDRLIQDVLNYSRVSRDELPLTVVDLDRLVRELIAHYPMLLSARVQVEGVLLPVLGNEAALTQCLSNLLGNAIKFVAPGTPPSLRIWSEQHGSRVRTCIQDNGIGIAPEHQDQIWGIFQRLHSGESYEGTGIGLSIVKKAVERMGGTVGLESELGRGSIFWFELGRAPEAEAKAQEPERPGVFRESPG